MTFSCSTSIGQPDHDPGTVSDLGNDLKVRAHLRRPLPHDGKAVMLIICLTVGGKTSAGIRDADDRGAVLFSKRNLHLARPCVLSDIGQCFLDDFQQIDSLLIPGEALLQVVGKRNLNGDTVFLPKFMGVLL